MGSQIFIRLVNEGLYENDLAPFLGRDFVSEISWGHLWLKRSPFLSKKEEDLLRARTDMHEDYEQPVDPTELAKVLTKVNDYLKANESTLPFEIEIDYARMEQEGLETDLIINNSRCWIQGDSEYYKVTNKVKIVNVPMEPNEVDVWIDIAEEVAIEGKLFYLKRTTRYEKFKEILEKTIAFCRYAQGKNEKVLWQQYN
jgi:hypothetical protein